MKIPILHGKTQIPVELSGAEIKKTTLGYKAKCQRCGAWIKFGKVEIETAGPAKGFSVFQQVASGYLVVKENNSLANDVEARKIDWVEFLRRERNIIYQRDRFPAATSGTTAIELICEKCSGKTTIHTSIGGDIALKKLLKSKDALILLGIRKENSVKFFQLRTGKLASKFTKDVETSEKDMNQIKAFKKLVDDFCRKLESEATLSGREFLADIEATASASMETKIRQLEQWQKTVVGEVERLMFPDVGFGLSSDEQIQALARETGLHPSDARSLQKELRRYGKS